ncbi:MAG: phosphatase PAP2 family protein [Pseudomonadota bacterium]
MIQEYIYASDSLNVALFHAINDMQSPVLQQIMLFATMLGKYTMFAVYLPFLGLLFLLRARKLRHSNVDSILIRNQIIETGKLLIASYVFYLVWVWGLKHLLQIPRPFVALPQGSVFILDSVRNAENPFVSFPSGHAAFSMLMLASLWQILGKPGKIIGVFLLLLIGFSRVSLGVHFPSDIIISWILSFGAVCLVKFVLNKFIKTTS